MQTPRCLIVTADRFLAGLIDMVLDHGAYERQVATALAEAEARMAAWRPHLLVLDVDMEEGAGIAAVERWKRAAAAPPIVGVTRRDTIAARLAAFQGGVDDLLAVPFPPEELVARCIGVMRRVHGRDVAFVPEITVGPLRVDLLDQRIRAEDRVVGLSRIQKALVYVLAANAGEAMSRDQLLDYVWGWDRDVGSNLIDRHIADLRAKLGDDPREPRFIETVAGEGYRFKVARRS